MIYNKAAKESLRERRRKFAEFLATLAVEHQVIVQQCAADGGHEYDYTRLCVGCGHYSPPTDDKEWPR